MPLAAVDPELSGKLNPHLKECDAVFAVSAEWMHSPFAQASAVAVFRANFVRGR